MKRREFMSMGAASLGAVVLGGAEAGAAGAEGTEIPMPPVYPRRERLVEAYREHVGFGHLRALERSGVDLVVGAREGARMQDAYTGRWYWDCHRVGNVYNLGHRHPRVVAAMRRALDQLEIGNSHLVAQYKAWAAEKLVASTGGQLPGVIWTSSGTEANEVGIKAARGITRRRRIVALEDSYHGHSGLTIAAAGNDADRERFLMDYPDEFVRVPWNDEEAMVKAVDDRTAAVLLEPMPARLGFPPPRPGYLARVKELCRERGALVIFDEVITGVGASGTFWLYQQESFVPDVLTTAKGLGGGIGAAAAALVSGAVYRFLGDGYLGHLTTFGGHELACVAAATTCDVVMEPGFLEHVRALRKRFEDGFASAPFELTGRGLCMGLLLPRPENQKVLARLYQNGVLAAGGHPNVIQLRVPLVLTLEEADEIIVLVKRSAEQALG